MSKTFIGKQEFKPAPALKSFPDWQRVYCPFCKTDQWWSGIRMHLTRMAQSEAFLLVTGEIKEAPHLEFWKKNVLIARKKYIWKF